MTIMQYHRFVPASVVGKIAVVTGAAGGQGAAEAAALAAEGATVIATDIIEPLDALAPGVTFRKLDVSQLDQWQDLAAWIEGGHGRLDVLVNNAARTSLAVLADVTPEEWEATFRVNVTGPMYGMQTMAPLMTSGGSIINIASIAGLTGHHLVAYTSAKWALRGLSRVASLELGSRQIRVNTLFPGFVETPMTAKAPPQLRELAIADIPLGRVGVVSDIAPLVVFLASDESSWITGTEISVDGGAWAHGGQKAIADALSPVAVAYPSPR